MPTPALISLETNVLVKHVLSRLPTPALGALACSCRTMSALTNGTMKARMNRCIKQMGEELLAAYKESLNQKLLLRAIHASSSATIDAGVDMTDVLINEMRKLNRIARFWDSHPYAQIIAHEVVHYHAVPEPARRLEHVRMIVDALQEYEEEEQRPLPLA